MTKRTMALESGLILIKARLGRVLAMLAIVFIGLSSAPSSSLAADTTIGQTVYNALTSQCVFCSFVSQVIGISDTAAHSAFKVFAGPVATMMQTCFDIYLLILAVELMTGMAGSPGSVVKRLVLVSFMYTISWTALVSQQTLFWDWMYATPLTSGAQASNALFAAVPLTGISVASGSSCGSSAGITSSMSFSAADVQAITCHVQQFERLSFAGIAVAVAGFSSASIDFSVWSGFGESLVKIAGIFISNFPLLIIFGTSVLTYPLFVIDLLIRSALVAALSPLLIAGLPFAPTRGFFFAAIKSILSSAVTLAAATVVFLFAGVLMGKVSGALGVTASSDGGITSLLNYVENNPNSLIITQPGWWFLFGSGLLSATMSRKVGGLVSSLFGLSDSGIGIAGEAAKVIQSTARLAGTAALAIGTAGAGAAALGGGAVAGGLAGIGGSATGQAAGSAVASGLGRAVGALGARAMQPFRGSGEE